MTKTAKYRNERLEVLHKTAAGLARLGALGKTTMREFDAFCLTKVEPMTHRI
jgi:putative transcriptional regulator